MPPSQNDNNFGLPASPNLLPWFCAGIGLVVVGIIWVSWVFVESLQENSKAMRKYKIQSTVTMNEELRIGSDSLVDSYDLASKSPQVESLYQDGVKLQQANKFREALPKFQSSLEEFKQLMKGKTLNMIDKKHIVVRLERIGECQAQLYDFKSAAKSYEESIAVYPGQAQSFHALLQLYTSLKMPKKVAETQARMQNLSPSVDSKVLMKDYGREVSDR